MRFIYIHYNQKLEHFVYISDFYNMVNITDNKIIYIYFSELTLK